MVIANLSSLSSVARKRAAEAGYDLKSGERKKKPSSSSKSKTYLVTDKGEPVVEVSSGFAAKYEKSVKELQAKEQEDISKGVSVATRHKTYSQIARDTTQMQQQSYQDTALTQSVSPRIKTYKDIGIEKEISDYRSFMTPRIKELTEKEKKTHKRVQRFEPLYQFKEAAIKGVSFEPYAEARSGSGAQALGYAAGLGFSIATIGGATGTVAGRGLAAASTRSRAVYGILSGASKVTSFKPISLGLKTVYGVSVVTRGVSAAKKEGLTGIARVGFTTARDISFLGSTSKGFKEGLKSSIGYSRVRSSTIFGEKYITPRGQVARGTYSAVLSQPYTKGYSIVKSRVTALTPSKDLVKSIYGQPFTLRKGQTYAYTKGIVFDVKPRFFRKPKITTRSIFSVSKAKVPSIFSDSMIYRSTGFGYGSDFSKFKAITTQKPLKPISTNKYIKSVSAIESISAQKSKSGFLVFEEKGILKEIGIDKKFTAFKGTTPSIKPSSKPSTSSLFTQQQANIKVFELTPKPSIEFAKLINVPTLNVQPVAIPFILESKQKQVVKPKLISIPKTETRSKLKVFSSVIPTLKLESSVLSKTRSLTQSKSIVSTISTPKAATSLFTSTSAITSVIPAIAPVIPVTVMQTPTPSAFVTPSPFALPLFDLDLGLKKKKKKIKKVRRKPQTSYAPTLFATAFEIKAPKGAKTKGKFTGLEIRGLLK